MTEPTMIPVVASAAATAAPSAKNARTASNTFTIPISPGRARAPPVLWLERQQGERRRAAADTAGACGLGLVKRRRVAANDETGPHLDTARAEHELERAADQRRKVRDTDAHQPARGQRAN